MPIMKSLQTFRLATTTGHCVQVQANTPVYIPDAIYQEALSRGMIIVDEPVPTDDEEQPNVLVVEEQDEDEDENPDPVDHLEQAILRVITRNDEGDFKNDGVPRVLAVNKELPPEAEQASSTQIQEVFERLQENIDLAEIED